MTDKAVVSLRNLSFTYPGGTSPVFKDFSLSVGGSEFVAIVGGSGVGKSTILRIASGLIQAESGSVEISIAKEPSRRRPDHDHPLNGDHHGCDDSDPQIRQRKV